MNRSRILAACLVLWFTTGALTFAQTPTWTSLSTGLVYTVVCDAGVRVIVGTQAGVAISHNHGKTWPIHGVYKPVHALALDSAGRIYAGSEKGNIYVSEDGGVTWNVGNTGSRATFNSLCVSMTGVVYASAEGYGVYASTDHGASWREAGFSGITVYAVAVNSRDVLFASRYGAGLFKSNDGGVTWTKTSLAGTSVRTLSVGPNDEIYAGVQYSGVWLSVDSGATWMPHGLSGKTPTYLVTSPGGVPVAGTSFELLSGSLADTTWMPVPVSWSTATSAIALEDDSTMYAVTAGEIYARTGSTPWLQCGLDTRLRTSNALLSSATRIVAASSRPGLLYAGIGGFVWQSLDTSVAEQEIHAIAEMQGGRVLFAGTGDGRVLISRDSAEHWKPTAFTSDAPLVTALAVRGDGQLYAGTLGDGIRRSSDEGAHWTALNSGLGDLYVRSLLPCSGGRLLAGTDGGLYLSTDNGDHWLSLPLLDGLIWCLTQDTYGIIYAGTGEKGIFRSMDEGDTWSPLNNGLTCLSVKSVASNNNGRVFAGTLGGGVFQSVNGGMSWAPMNSGLSDPDIFCLTTTPDGTLYAGTRQNWISRISMGSVVSVQDPSPGLPLAMTIEQNYPNPFNPTTRIRYTVGRVVVPSGALLSGVEGPSSSKVSLVVYDLLGREVAVLVDEKKAPGTYQVTFDGSRLASGLYLYRITAGSQAETKKMLLLK